MASAAVSTPPRPGRRSNAQGPGTEDGSKGIWSSMLDSVGSGKKLAEKSLLILGGTAETQKEFLDALATEDGAPGRRPYDRLHSKKPPVANRFALGYTYQDILDADQDDILARLSLYLLGDCHSSFSSLLEPLFTTTSIPETLVVILLDWDSPWSWARQLRDWIRILRTALDKLDNNSKDAMGDYMKDWMERRKGADIEGVSAPSEGDGAVPLGPGAWDEALGIPLCVVCQRAEHTEVLEREHAWKDDEFDFVQQWLRTILLKHGAGLIYTASSAPGSLPTLIKSSLGVRSLLQRNPLKHNVIDRDKILVPPNWDSWGKIKPLGENFDIEGVSNAWSLDIQGLPGAETERETMKNGHGEGDTEQGPTTSAVTVFETRIEDPDKHRDHALQLGSDRSAGIETQCQDMQEFLGQQHKALESLRAEDDREQKSKEAKRPGTLPGMPQRDGQAGTGSKVNEHIGPVQFNMGGIQVDADDMLKSLKEREAGRSPTEENSVISSPDGKLEHEKLSSFFAGLMSRSSNSATNSPRAPRSDTGTDGG